MWGAFEGGTLREFLASATGRRLAYELLNAAPLPVIPPGVSAEYVLGCVAGYARMVSTLNALAGVTDAVQAGATTGAMYPDLEDDTKWEQAPDS